MEMNSDTIRIFEEIYGRNHSFVATSMDNVANIHRQRGNLEKAMETYQETYRI